MVGCRDGQTMKPHASLCILVILYMCPNSRASSGYTGVVKTDTNKRSVLLDNQHSGVIVLFFILFNFLFKNMKTTHTHTHTHTHTRVYMCMLVFTHVHLCRHGDMHIYVVTYVHTYVCTCIIFHITYIFTKGQSAVGRTITDMVY